MELVKFPAVGESRCLGLRLVVEQMAWEFLAEWFGRQELLAWPWLVLELV